MNPQYQQAMIQALMNGNGGNRPTPDQINTASNPMMNQFIAGAPPQQMNPASLSPFSPQPLSQQAAIGRGY